MTSEVIDVTGQEVPERRVLIGHQVVFTPTNNPDPNGPLRGLIAGHRHLGLIIGSIRGRPLLRIYSPLGTSHDATFEHTGSEGTWDYLDEVV